MSNKPIMDKDFYLETDTFFERNISNGLTFDDLSLATRYSEVLPANVNLETDLSESVKLSIPILSSDMDTVTESNMAIAMALCGGMGLSTTTCPEDLKSKKLPELSIMSMA